MTCIKCGEEKPINSFGLATSSTSRRRKTCRDCASKYSAEWYKKNKEVEKQKRLEYQRNNLTGYAERQKRWRKANPDKTRYSRYKLTKEKYESLVEKQNSKCGVCKKPLEKIHIDHDHACCNLSSTCGNCVRGLLCPDCNIGLGNFKDNVEVLKAAITYLEKHDAARTERLAKSIET